MMTNNVVKTNQVAKLFKSYSDAMCNSTTRELARNKSSDFTRDRNMTFRDVILYFIFRHSKDTNTELTKYFCSIGHLEKRISKQALNADIRKLNPSVFRHLMREFARMFYQSKLPKYNKGYIVLAEDGTFIEIPYRIRNIYQFGFLKNQYVTEVFDVKKVVSKSAGLYDVTNGIFLDFMMRPGPYSEMPLAFQHLYSCGDYLSGKKVIYLADRYYGSVELFSHLEHLGFDYCIRAKSNFFKKQIRAMKTNDEWIELEIDEKWLGRFRFSPEATNLRAENPKIKIRVVKFKYEYENASGNNTGNEITYFTSLSKEEFSSDDIIELYSSRWNIEEAYKTLKTEMELERHISESPTVSQCCIYGKVIFYNIIGVMRKEIDKFLSHIPGKHRKTSRYKSKKVLEEEEEEEEEDIIYQVNVKQLYVLMVENNMLQAFHRRKKLLLHNKLKQIVEVAKKIKVPIRPDRHNQRWGKIVGSGYRNRFSLDGRNFPKLKTVKGVMMTTAP